MRKVIVGLIGLGWMAWACSPEEVGNPFGGADGSTGTSQLSGGRGGTEATSSNKDGRSPEGGVNAGTHDGGFPSGIGGRGTDWGTDGGTAGAGGTSGIGGTDRGSPSARGGTNETTANKADSGVGLGNGGHGRGGAGNGQGGSGKGQGGSGKGQGGTASGQGGSASGQGGSGKGLGGNGNGQGGSSKGLGGNGNGQGGTTSGQGGSSPGQGGGLCGAAPGQLFGSDHPWNQKIDEKPLDAESSVIVSYLQTNHTASARFRIDGPTDEADSLYGIVVMSTDATAPHQAFTESDEFYSPDCDPAPPPIPTGGAIEGETSYACNGDGDCHLIVVDTAECRLYEMWRANRTSASSFQGGCQAVWDLRETYRPTLRGDCCTSADAAGLPIAAHMFTADEVAAGQIQHAIRFILPNSLIRERIYVRPATHATGTTGPSHAPPYGVRMRLKASFDETKLKPAARVVARALKEYGMILSDGGNVTFTAANDRFTSHKWRDLDFGPGDLTAIQWNDFEVPELGTRYTWNNSCNCQRTPIER